MLSAVRSLSAISLFLLSVGSASANNFTYNNLEFRIAGGPANFGVAYNMQFMENAHFIARVDSEFSGDYDLAGGVGFNGPMGQFADLTGQMLLHNIKEGDSKNVIGNDILPEINIGTRVWFMDGIETHAKLGMLIDDDENHTVWALGARFHSTQQLVVGGAILNNGIYDTQIMMSARFNY